MARVRHGVSDLFGGHSHDVADQVDHALEVDDAGRRALWISLAILTATALLQGLVVALSGSTALTAVPLLVAFRLASRPPTKTMTYGYGRAEDLAGLFVVVMIAVSCTVAAYESAMRLFNPEPVTHLWAVAAAALIGFTGNELIGQYRIGVGRAIGSAALVADGLHARTDGFTSLAVLVGAGGVALGADWADPIVGLLISVAILGVLRSAVRQVGARLMDAVDPDIVDQATEAISTVDGIHEVRELRVRWLGHTLRAEADVTVDSHLDVTTAHDIAHHAEEHLLAAVPRLTAATIHVSPSGAHRA